MRLEQLPSVGEVVSTLEAQRQRLSDADLVGASRSALTSARDALPDGWTRRRRASRWPLVAGVILGTTMLGLVLMAPALRRWAASVWASGRPTRGTARPTPIPGLSAREADYKTRVERVGQLLAAASFEGPPSSTEERDWQELPTAASAVNDQALIDAVHQMSASHRSSPEWGAAQVDASKRVGQLLSRL